MNKSLLLSLILITLSLCGCTHNDGDIGALFGEWTMTDLKVDGQQDNLALKGVGYVWAFQSHIICIKKVMPHNEYGFYWGSWQMDNDILTLDYTHGTKPGASTAPEDIYLTDSKMPMIISWETNKNIVLTYTDPEGRKIQYTLKKQW